MHPWDMSNLLYHDKQTPVVQKHLHEVAANQDPLYEQTNGLLKHDDYLHPNKQESIVFLPNPPTIERKWSQNIYIRTRGGQEVISACLLMNEPIQVFV